ncbi:MAG: DMT family transporter [Calditrichia bacterium]
MKTYRLTDLLLLVFMSILFGLTFIATKYALQGLGVFQVVFARYVLAFLVLTIILRKKRKFFYISPGDFKYFLALTMVEPVGYFVLETFGVQFTSPSNVSLIIATIPVFAVIFAAIVIKERPTILTFGGIALSILGVYFIVSTQEASALAPRPFLGNILTLGAAVAAGLYNTLARQLTQRYSPLTVTYYQTMVATVVFFPGAIIEYFIRGEIHFDWLIIGNVLYLALGGSILAYLLLNYSLSRLGVARVSIFSNFIPVVTIVTSYFLFGEMLQPLQLLGAGLVITGIYLTYKPAGISNSAGA